MKLFLYFTLIFATFAAPLGKPDITYSACENKYEGCNDWKKSGMCEMNQYKDYMTMTCPVACGFCSQNQITPEEPRVPSAEVQASPNYETPEPAPPSAPIASSLTSAQQPEAPQPAQVAPSPPSAAPAIPISPYNPQVDSAPFNGPKTTVDFIGPMLSPVAGPPYPSPVLAANPNPALQQAAFVPQPQPASASLINNAPVPQPEPIPLIAANAAQKEEQGKLMPPPSDEEDNTQATNESGKSSSKHLDKIVAAAAKDEKETVEGSGSGEGPESHKSSHKKIKRKQKITKHVNKKVEHKIIKKVEKAKKEQIHKLIEEGSGSGDEGAYNDDAAFNEGNYNDLEESDLIDPREASEFTDFQDDDFETLISTEERPENPYQLRSEIQTDQSEDEESGDEGSGVSRRTNIDSKSKSKATKGESVLSKMLAKGAIQAFAVKRPETSDAPKHNGLSAAEGTPNVQNSHVIHEKKKEASKNEKINTKATSRHALSGGETDIPLEDFKLKLESAMSGSGISGSGEEIAAGILHLTLRQMYDAKYGDSKTPAFQILAGNFKKDLETALKMEEESISDVTFSETAIEGNPRTSGKVRVNFRLAKNADKLKDLVGTGNINGLLVVKNSLEGMVPQQ